MGGRHHSPAQEEESEQKSVGHIGSNSMAMAGAVRVIHKPIGQLETFTDGESGGITIGDSVLGEHSDETGTSQ